MQTALYRHFNNANELLYIGISLSAVQRLGQHQKHSHWFSSITHLTITQYINREAAISAETIAIGKEKPLHNIKHNKPSLITYKPHIKTQWERWQETKAAVEHEITKVNAVYTGQEISTKLGIQHKQLTKCVQAKLITAIHTSGTIDINGIDRRKWLITGWAFIDFLDYLENTEIAPWTYL